MERTNMEGGVVTLGHLEFIGLMKQLIGVYKFRHGNELPTKVVIPSVSEVDGVTIEYPVTKKKVPTVKEASSEE